jgi:subtilase family serine protease
MNMPYRIGWLFALAAAFPVPAVYAQTGPQPQIREAVDESRLAVLPGNTRPEANAGNDRGIVPDSFAMDHMLLQLQRPPARETELKQYIDGLNDPNAANFHQWLTPEQFAAQYGVAQSDVDAVSGWLKGHGFAVHGIQPGGLTIDFGGTAGQVRSTFHTEIHNLEVNGARHIANMSDPRIPAALRPVVAGIVSLHDFRPHPLLVPRGQYTYTNPNGTFHALVPGDIATIYNLTPAFAAGYTGKGQSIMVLEDTYLYSTADVTTFRQTFGLTSQYPYATFSQVSPSGAIACANPGFQGSPSDPGYGDDSEAIIDVEWATAAAPNAAIILAACTDSRSDFGGLLALLNVLNGPAASLPSVVSISYGEAEASNGASTNLLFNNAYQQAVAEGVSIFVSAGDFGAAFADHGNVSTHGIGISGFTSTPYNVSVGGLDFSYTADGVNPATYWSATNSSVFSSALSYIQEIPWNNSCAGGVVSGFFGISRLDLCNNPAVTSSSGPLNFLLNAVGGSGGPSRCSSGTPELTGIVTAGCVGYKKPAWQTGLVGNPIDDARDVPDVSLFASNGFWDAYYVVCWSNPDPNVGGGGSCTGQPSAWPGFGGTSVASPIMAGIQALINQKTASRWGNPNTVYYSLAKAEYGAGGSSACNSISVNKTSNSCIFYDVTQGDNDVVCQFKGLQQSDCFQPNNATYGILSTSNSVAQPAYSATVGWDFTSGIGSVNVWNLIANWPAP